MPRCSALALLLGVPLLSACAESASTPTATTQLACAVLSPAKLQQLLGVPVGAGTETDTGGVSTCSHTAGGTGSVLVRISGNSSSSAMQTARNSFTGSGQPVSPVTGIGDEAFASTLGSGQFATTTVVARHGTTQVLVTVSGSAGDLARTEQVVRAALAAL